MIEPTLTLLCCTGGQLLVYEHPYPQSGHNEPRKPHARAHTQQLRALEPQYVYYVSFT